MRISDWSSDVCSSDLLGFDHFERTLDRVAKMSADGYPPYNIEQIGAARLRITLAVAGFGESDLSIRIEDNQLVVRGKQRVALERLYLHRGLAPPQLQLSCIRAHGIGVLGAEPTTKQVTGRAEKGRNKT